MKEKEIERWIKGILLFGIGLFVFFSIFSFNAYDRTFSFCQIGVPQLENPANFGGKFGAYLSGFLIFLFGKSSYILVLLIMTLGWNSIWGEKSSLWIKLISVTGLLITFSAFFSLKETTGLYPDGGIAGLITTDFLFKSFGEKGIYLVLSILGVGFLGIGNKIFISPLKGYVENYVSARNENVSFPSSAKKRIIKRDVGKKEMQPVAKEEKGILRKDREPEKIRRKRLRKEPEFKLPSIDFLKTGSPTQKETKGDLERYAQVIEETLSEFGMEGEIVQINQGPRVTMYELQLAPGIQVQKVNKISDNIAMNLKTTTIRIVAPLPNKSTVGIEVPNREISMVYFREIVSSKEFKRSHSKLTLAIGKDIMGNPIVSDLKIMPHLLIAGATGSGKTVCLNSLITSILYKATPEEVKFLLIDPKMVELTLYNDLPHLLLPVVVDVKKAVIALKWLIGEMERRYKLFSADRVRSIESYNAIHKEETLPYVVVVIDELADLMTIARNEIETSIIRLAQLSRAAGIHLILATQRPSVNVITGIIKANLPCRISFQVTSTFDSRTILDSIGAEKLLGRGDLLFVPAGSSRPQRVQGSFVSDEEIETVCEFAKEQKIPDYDMEILKLREGEKEIIPGSGGGVDELYEQAKRIIIDTRIASISMLQRRLQIGFNRAARLIETMEEEGIVGQYREGKPREVIIPKGSGYGR